MKDYKIILVAFACIVIICAIFALGYQNLLRQHNDLLMVNINRLQKRIDQLEKEKTMEQIIALRAENAALKSQIHTLQEKGSLMPGASSSCAGKVASKPAAKAAKGAGGNKGYLIKDGRSSPPR